MKNLEILNRKVNHDYFIIDTLECGIELKGNEVKSIKNGNCNISDAFCQIHNNQLTIVNMYIAKWETSNLYDILGERRERRLLAHKNEIIKFNNKIMVNIRLVSITLFFCMRFILPPLLNYNFFRLLFRINLIYMYKCNDKPGVCPFFTPYRDLATHSLYDRLCKG